LGFNGKPGRNFIGSPWVDWLGLTRGPRENYSLIGWANRGQKKGKAKGLIGDGLFTLLEFLIWPGGPRLEN